LLHFLLIAWSHLLMRLAQSATRSFLQSGKWIRTMANTLIRIYDNLSAAQHAREQLLGAGFSQDSVQLESRMDEAGPVENNFILDEKDTGKGPSDGPLHKLFGTEERTDAYGNADPKWRGSYQLSVDADDDAQAARASDIMDRSGARDVDALTSWRRRES
jgi:hypothetical protein